MDQRSDPLATHLRDLGHSVVAKGVRVEVRLPMGTKLRVDFREPPYEVRTGFGFVPAGVATALDSAIAISGLAFLIFIHRLSLEFAVGMAGIAGWDVIRYARSRPAVREIREFLQACPLARR